MAITLTVCPVCTEHGVTPITLKLSKAGHKYQCPECKAEYWLKVTKNSDPNYVNSMIRNSIERNLSRNNESLKKHLNFLAKEAKEKKHESS